MTFIPSIVNMITERSCTAPLGLVCCGEVIPVMVLPGHYKYVTPSCGTTFAKLRITATGDSAGFEVFASTKTLQPNSLTFMQSDTSTSLVKTVDFIGPNSTILGVAIHGIGAIPVTVSVHFSIDFSTLVSIASVGPVAAEIVTGGAVGAPEVRPYMGQN